jgi:hypothetical protein
VAVHGNVRVPLSSNWFLAARRRPAVRVGLDPPSPFAGLLVSVADPEAAAVRITDAKQHRGTEGKH